jgi:hypothetical protein
MELHDYTLLVSYNYFSGNIQRKPGRAKLFIDGEIEII